MCQAIIPQMKAHNKVICAECSHALGATQTKLVVAEKTRRICKCLWGLTKVPASPCRQSLYAFLPYWHVRSRHLGWELPAKSLVLSLWSAMICQELEHCPFMCTLEALQMLFWCASVPPSHERIHLPWKKDGGPRWLPQLLWWVVKWPCQQTLTSPWTAMLLYLYLVRSVLAYIPLQPKSWRADPFKTFWLPTSGWFPTTLFTLSSLPTQCILQSSRIEQRLNECNGLIAYLRQSSLAIALSWKTA